MTQLCLFYEPTTCPFMFHLPGSSGGDPQTTMQFFTGEFAGLRAFQYLTGVGDPRKGDCRCVAELCFGGKDFLCRMVPQILRDHLQIHL